MTSRTITPETVPLRWPTAQPTDVLDYGLELSSITATDPVVQATIALAPSGTGEMQVVSLGLVGTVITVVLTGGQPGRVYRAQLTITGASGRVWVFPISIRVSVRGTLALALSPLSDGFGIITMWSSGQTPFIFGLGLIPVATDLIGIGTNQATALLLSAQTNIITSAPASTGFILPSGVVGTIFVQNTDPVNNAQIYPPVGAQINALGANVPFIIGAGGGRISFVTNASTTQWVAG